MPYIKQESRPPLDAAIKALPHEGAGMQLGEIAYVVYRLMLKNTVGGSFSTYAGVCGAVGLTLVRFVLKVVMKYEDEKEAENGGVD